MLNVHKTKTTGFTLIEILVAVVIASIVLTSSITLLSSSWAIIQKSQERNYVAGILESRMEELRDLTYDQIYALGSEVTFDVEPDKSVTGTTVTVVLDPADYQKDLKDAVGKVYIADIGSDLINVIIEVKWKPNGGNDEVSMSLVTDITRNGAIRQ